MADCIHDMNPAWCAICRNLPDPGHEPTTTRPSSSGPGPWFEARFSGCCACGESIEMGEEIRADGQGQYVGRCCEGEDDD